MPVVTPKKPGTQKPGTQKPGTHKKPGTGKETMPGKRKA
jgi:hypothetical protein